MPRGQPDYGMYAVKEVSASISDMGEVAARLGSIVTYDKRGDVVDFDNFEEPVLRWARGFWGGGNVPVLTTASAKSGSQSVHLSAPNVIFSGGHILRWFPVLRGKRLGSEFSFSVGFTGFELWHDIVYYSGTQLFEAYAVINLLTSRVYVLNEVGAEVEVATFDSFNVSPYLYYTTKLVIDIDTAKYVRLLLGHNEYDISQTSLTVTPSFIAPYFLTRIGCLTLAAAGGLIYIDDSVLTQEEP